MLLRGSLHGCYQRIVVPPTPVCVWNGGRERRRWVIDGDLCNERKKPLKPNNMNRIEILSRVHFIKGRTISQFI